MTLDELLAKLEKDYPESDIRVSEALANYFGKDGRAFHIDVTRKGVTNITGSSMGKTIEEALAKLKIPDRVSEAREMIEKANNMIQQANKILEEEGLA